MRIAIQINRDATSINARKQLFAQLLSKQIRAAIVPMGIVPTSNCHEFPTGSIARVCSRRKAE
ncbi:MAG TPA: hypothetical protein VFE47_24165 [Tepidisphaeraceae bacterium]|nr:hypothetical protein [Tepidisphaeraceae bacterium]